jgi:hypothetical protein
MRKFLHALYSIRKFTNTFENRTPDTQEVVLQSFTEDGTRSVRNVADIQNQSKNTVQNILKGCHMHPNHYTKVQRLLSED